MSKIPELRAAARRLARRPSVTLFAVLTVALGVGANSAVFSLLDGVVLRPLPVVEPDRLVVVEQRGGDGRGERVGFQTYLDLAQGLSAFDSIAVAAFWQPAISGQGESETLAAQRVSASFFATLGVEPRIGRSFTPDEDRPGAPRVVLLSHGFWQRRFGGDPGVVGRSVTLDETAYEVIGVLPPRMETTLRAGVDQTRALDLLGPLRYSADLPQACRSCQHLAAIGRLRGGVTLATAKAELDSAFAALADAHPEEYPGRGGVVAPFLDRLTERARPLLATLQLGALLVVLLTAVNLAALLAARAIERERELGLLRALGVGTGRFLVSVGSEALFLVGAGALAGALLARPILHLLLQLAPASLPRLENVELSSKVFLFALGVTALAALVAGFAPALVALRTSSRALVATGAGTATTRGQHRLIEVVVIAEAAIAIVVVFAAGLLGRSLERLTAEDPGFEPHGALVASVSAATRSLPEDADVNRFYERAEEALLALPGVSAAGFTSQLPLGGNFDGYGLDVEDRPDLVGVKQLGATRYGVTPGYLRAIGLRLVAGRWLEASDRADADRVVVVDRALVERAWPDGDPIGKRLRMGGDEGPWRTVVGVVEGVRHTALDNPSEGQFYVPAEQWLFGDVDRVLVLRTAGDPAALAAPMRAAIHRLDPLRPIEEVGTLESVVARSTAPRRFALSLWSAFGTLALLLAATGIYGALSRVVASRRREIAVRGALGASPRELALGIAARSIRLVSIGALIAAPAAFALGRLLDTQLWRVGALDPRAGGFALAALALVTLCAAYGPARRAAGVDPASALRAE